MSQRQEIADRIAKFVQANDLAQVFGGDVTQERNAGRAGRHCLILISRRATLDGVVRVFSPGRIYIYTKGPLGFGASSFSSADKAIEFLRVAFVEGDRDAAHKLV